MMFYMDSKIFQDHYLVNEDDQDILNAQYVLVSNRIMRHDMKRDNILMATSLLFPNTEVLGSPTNNDLIEKYFKQLEGAKVWIAMTLTAVLEEGYNVIFICTKNEGKLKYLQYLAEFIEMEFGYPVYDYLYYYSGIEKLRKYDREAVLAKCNKIKEKTRQTKIKKILKTEINSKHDEKKVYGFLLQQPKDVLIGAAKKKGVYEKGMSKKELIRELMDFM